MKEFDISNLVEAHMLIDEFIRDKKLYQEARRRSEKKAISLVQARRLLKKAVDLLGDDKFYDVMSMLEEPPGPDEKISLQRAHNEDMRRDLFSTSEEVVEWGIVYDAFFDSIGTIKKRWKHFKTQGNTFIIDKKTS